MSSPSSRRAFLTLLGCGTAASALVRSKPALATLVRGLTLPEMVAQSARIVVVEPLDSHSHWQSIGGRRLIVTDTSVRVLDSLRADSAAEAQLVLRTLGGRIGDRSELVLGQPDFGTTGQGLAFLTRADDGVFWATGMAQGHFALSKEQVLSASRFLPTIMKWEHSAVKALHGQKLATARGLVAGAAAK